MRGGDIKSFAIDPSQLKKVAPDIAAAYSRTKLAGGEVLLAIRGTVGQTAVASADMAGMNISREVAMMPVLNGIDSRYLMFALGSPLGQELMLGHVKGVAQRGINLADLRKLSILVPPVSEQVQIVSSLSDAMQRIERLKIALGAMGKQLDTAERSILAKAFRGDLVPQDPDDEPASVLLERIRASKSEKPAPKRGRKQLAKKSLRNARDYTDDDWRRALLECLGEDDAEIEDAIEAAAIWAAENLGLEFERLRRNGIIVRGLEAALESAVRSGEVERLGPSTIRKARKSRKA